MRNHSEAEHKNNNVHSKRNRFRFVENIENSVIDDIYYKRIYCVVISFPQSDKNIIDYRTADIGNVKRR